MLQELGSCIKKLWAKRVYAMTQPFRQLSSPNLRVLQPTLSCGWQTQSIITACKPAEDRAERSNLASYA